MNVLANESNTILLSGDAKSNGRVPLTVSNESLTDIITLAGGPTHAPADTLVRVTRHNDRAEERLDTLEDDPEDNIVVEPQDHVHLQFMPRTYMVFGAAGRVTQAPFDVAHLSLAEAVARSGGLDDQRANPEALFLFRFENPTIAKALGQPPATTPVPVIYRVNMRDPQNFFLLQRIAMRDKDLIYVANARTVQLFKFLQIINAIFTPVVYSRAAAGN